MVDIARMPVYIALEGKQIWAIWQFILVAAIGVLIGTILGGWILKKIPESIFKKTVSVIILFIGIFVLLRDNRRNLVERFLQIHC